MLAENRLSFAIMVNVIVILEIDPLKIDEFLAVILENAAASRLESGCIRFEVSRDNEQSNLFALSESYVDQAAFDLHYTTPHVAQWRAQGPGFVLKRWAVKGPVY
jgi:autoinducer 2-degrading protein